MKVHIEIYSQLKILVRQTNMVNKRRENLKVSISNVSLQH